MTLRIGIVSPGGKHVRNGNRTTALRWAKLLRGLGVHVFLEEAWSGREADMLVALHAGKSRASIERFAREAADRPLLIAATGTDIYGPLSPTVAASFACADRILVLQPLATDRLPEELRSRSRVLYQSVPRPARLPERPEDRIEVCVIANLRPVKDPLLAARAARRLPRSSTVQVTLIGGALDAALEAETQAELARNPRFSWAGELTRTRTLERLARSHVLVSSSRVEGGANVLFEALAFDVAILATRIEGSVGILGPSYPGLYEPGDDEALARLLARFESEDAYRTRLVAAGRRLAPLAEPTREREAWGALLAELGLTP